MKISQLAKSLPESATLRLNEVARQLRARGEPVIHLGGGEPKSKVPMDAILAASSLLNSGEIRYTPSSGTVEMKKAIIRYTEEHYHRVIGPEHILVSNGAKQAISVALQAILDPQEEVIILAPYWVSYPEMVRIANGQPVIIYSEDGRFHPRMEDIEQAVTSNTRAVIVNSPNNPTGIAYSREFIEQIVRFCEKEGLYLIMDDIYNQLMFDGKKFANCFEFSTKSPDDTNIILINGVSKMYAMTGFRIGWAITNPRLIEAMDKIQGQTTSCPSALLQAAAVGALNGVQDTVESLRISLQNKRDVLVTELSKIDGVKITKPDGTFYCFPDFSAYEKDSVKLAQMLLEKARVVTIPGKEFGFEGHLRISFCGSIKDIVEGVERIRWVIDPSAPNEIVIGERKLVRDWL
jgi:aspartate aminotransferase